MARRIVNGSFIGPTYVIFDRPLIYISIKLPLGGIEGPTVEHSFGIIVGNRNGFNEGEVMV